MLHSAVKVVKPGKKRLISMFFNHSTSDYNFQPESANLEMFSRFPFLDSELISVSVDAVIYSDRTIAGPDRYDLRSRYLATRAAEHNEGYSLSWKLKKMEAAVGSGGSVDLAKIASLLDHDVQYGAASSPSSDIHAIHRFARSQEAALMKGLLASGGLDRLRANIAHRLRFPKDVLTRIG